MECEKRLKAWHFTRYGFWVELPKLYGNYSPHHMEDNRYRTNSRNEQITLSTLQPYHKVSEIVSERPYRFVIQLMLLQVGCAADFCSCTHIHEKTAKNYIFGTFGTLPCVSLDDVAAAIQHHTISNSQSSFSPSTHTCTLSLGQNLPLLSSLPFPLPNPSTFLPIA